MGPRPGDQVLETRTPQDYGEQRLSKQSEPGEPRGDQGTRSQTLKKNGPVCGFALKDTHPLGCSIGLLGLLSFRV